MNRVLENLRPLFRRAGILAASTIALGLAVPASAEAGDGLCVSTYSMQFPAGANQFYATKPHSNGVNVVEDPYPTAFRGGFTTSAKAEVWTVPAKENSFWWYVSSNRTLVGHPAPPVYSGTFSGGALAGYTQAEINAGLYPGYYTESRMMTDSETRIYRLNHHMDPQQFATRFVIKDVYPATLGNFNYAYTPDINVPDSAVQAAATANAAMLTQATVDRLRGYIESGSVTRNYLDLTPSAIIRNEGIGGVNGGNFTRWVNPDEFAGCGTFAEIVKHPRLQNVYILKYFIRTATIFGLAPFNKVARAGTFIAYAPYALGPSYQGPSLKPDSVTIDANTEATILPLSNDVAGSTGTLALTGVTVDSPAHGTASFSGSQVTYKPSAGWSGTETLTYTASDGTASYSARITVTVRRIAPKLYPDSVTTPANEDAVIKPLDNDVAGSTGTLDLVGVSSPAHGTVTWNGNNVTYSPDEDWSGMDTMTYTVTDGVDNYTSTIAVTVQSVPPVLMPDQIVTGHTVPITFNVLLNDKDIDGPNPLRVTAAGQPEHGAISFNPSGILTFVPEKGFIGTQTATYTATDGFNTAESFIVITTIQCFDDVWHDAGLVCSGTNPQGSADFAASCQYLPSGYEQVEKTCPAN